MSVLRELITRKLYDDAVVAFAHKLHSNPSYLRLSFQRQWLFPKLAKELVNDNPKLLKLT